MSGKNLKIVGVLVIAGLVSFFQAPMAHGFTIYELVDPTYTVADLLANPNQFASWDPDTPGGSVVTLTYKFDSSFTSDPRMRNQVRLGLQEWDQANVTPKGTTYSYMRNTALQDFFDLRTLTIHEFGHNLGFVHPFAGTFLNRNYGFNPTPPPILVTQPDRGDECMGYGTMPGGYNLILSHDELDAYQYSYGGMDLNLVEITSGTPDVLLKAEDMGPGAYGYGPPTGVPRDPADPTKGVRIISAEIVFGTTTFPAPVGFRTLGQNWDVQSNVDKATRGFEIETRGTNNPNPFTIFNGDPTGFRFDSLSTSWTGDPNNKDDLLHTWSEPRFWTSSLDIPAGKLHHVGLEMDVWDWTVISSRAVHPDGSKTYVPLVAFSQWNETVTGVDVTTSTGGIVAPDPLPEIIAEGIRITNSEDSPCDLIVFGVAVVDGWGLQLGDLNRDTLDELIDAELFETFDIVPRLLDYGEELFLVLDGEPVVTDNTLPLDRPDLVGHELFVYAQTRTLDATVGSYGLLGTAPILIPEPSTLVLAAVGLLALLGFARRSRTRQT